jgi:hypothetical protein
LGVFPHLDTLTLEVVRADSKRERERWLRLPWALYEDYPGWVPNLLMLQRDTINVKKNPFFDHGEAQLFLALRDGRPVGRISAQIDERHNRHHNERTGFFGFFESIDDTATAQALLSAAEDWVREHDMDIIRGPYNLALDEEVGMQIEGFDQPAMIQMPQTQPYYPALLEGAGYTKAMDLNAFRWQITDPPARMMTAVDRTRKAPGLTLRTVNMRRLHEEVDLLLEIYTDAWDDSWGYVPVSQRKARKLADDLRLIADPALVIFAEVDGETAGMVVGLPNLYEATRDFNGFLDPVKALKLLWRLKLRGTESGRILLFGVKKKFQRRRELYGLPFVLLHELYLRATKKRYTWCEESWILETNARLNALMPNWDAYVYKRYRIYEKTLGPAQ